MVSESWGMVISVGMVSQMQNDECRMQNEDQNASGWSSFCILTSAFPPLQR
jgi:hypothetical protein